MKRIVVAGARGFFGSAVLTLLKRDGVAATAASRRADADVQLDVEDAASIRAALHEGDVLVDATAPFQRRTTGLVQSAIAVGFDLVDLNDSLSYARRVAEFDAAARTRGVRLFNGCSSVSVLSAFAIARSRIASPIRVHGFLAPATRHTANRGVAASFLASVGQPIDVWRDGAWTRARGWIETREFASIHRRGHLIETADAFTLPRSFPSLRDVGFWVDPNTRGAGIALAIAARVPPLGAALGFAIRHGGAIARMLGRGEGVLAYEIEGDHRRRAVAFRGRDSFLMAAIPAAIAARRLADGLVEAAGVIPPDAQVPEAALSAALECYS